MTCLCPTFAARRFFKHCFSVLTCGLSNTSTARFSVEYCIRSSEIEKEKRINYRGIAKENLSIHTMEKHREKGRNQELSYFKQTLIEI